MSSPRESFDLELKRLHNQTLQIGEEVSHSIIKAADALVSRDMLPSRRVVEVDRWVNENRINVMLGSFALIATQAPAAKDMRFLAAVVEIAGELERIHDYAKGIAKISLRLGDAQLPCFYVEKLPTMAELALDMLVRAMDAFERLDAGLARGVPPEDDRVDALFQQLYADIIKFVTEDPYEIERANQLEWAMHNLERAADRAINICEWVVYVVSGVYEEMDADNRLVWSRL
jgi:phosphate transport system protein